MTVLKSHAAIPVFPPACTYLSLTFLHSSRLQAATQEAEAVRRDQTVWERKVGELQNRCSTLEEEKYEALAKVRESIQVAEEATLQREQVTLPFCNHPFFCCLFLWLNLPQNLLSFKIL